MTLGTMAVDREIRIDYGKLREDRLRKAKEKVKEYQLGAVLCFDPDNIRYITSTALGQWTNNKLARYCVLPGEKDPTLFEIGSAIGTKKVLSPWIKDRIRPSTNSMRGTIPPAVGAPQKCAEEIISLLKDYDVHKEPLGVDITDISLIRALEAGGVKVVDGQQAMLDAQMIKTNEEIELLKLATAMVDAAYWEVANFVSPGVRENEVAALIRQVLFNLGAEEVQNINVITGPRTHPHPHDFSDRIIRPGDLIFMDVVNVFNGYKTCYYRTFVCGSPTRKQKEIYQRCYDWLYTSIDKVKPGATTRDIAECWPGYEEIGPAYKNEHEALALEFGHGIGISHWGKPIISRGFSLEHPEEIKENMVIALETYVGDGTDGARIEEEVVVTKNGCEIITKFPSQELISCW